MKTIKLFEDFYSTLPSGMKMEDVVKLSPDDFLKLAEETLRSGAGTDQNEFHTIVKTYFSENQKAKADINILTRFGNKTTLRAGVRPAGAFDQCQERIRHVSHRLLALRWFRTTGRRRP